jgi:hypothetical protein
MGIAVFFAVKFGPVLKVQADLYRIWRNQYYRTTKYDIRLLVKIQDSCENNWHWLNQ